MTVTPACTVFNHARPNMLKATAVISGPRNELVQRCEVTILLGL